MSGKLLGFPDPADEATNPTTAAVGAMGAGTSEPPAHRRREDRDRFDGQARAWEAFREAKRKGGDDADALAAALDVFYEAMLVAAVRRYTGK